jgi:hypothetical protein
MKKAHCHTYRGRAERRLRAHKSQELIDVTDAQIHLYGRSRLREDLTIRLPVTRWRRDGSVWLSVGQVACHSLGQAGRHGRRTKVDVRRHIGV